jgi:hypothetical protein
MRDVCVSAFLLGWTLGTAAFIAGPSLRRAIAYTAVLALQYLVSRLAAANYGRRFVCTVLAVSSTKTGVHGG